MLNKVLKSIWVNMWCGEWGDLSYLSHSSKNSCRAQHAATRWEATLKVFMIHDTEKGADTAICTAITPPVTRAHNIYVYFFSSI